MWNGEGLPDATVLEAMAIDLSRLQGERNAGKLADEINRRLPGTSSVVKASARKLAQNSDEDLAAQRRPSCSSTRHEKWARPGNCGRPSRSSGRSIPSTAS